MSSIRKRRSISGGEQRKIRHRTAPSPAAALQLLGLTVVTIGLIALGPRDAAIDTGGYAWLGCLAIAPAATWALVAIARGYLYEFLLSPAGLALAYLWASVIIVPIAWRTGLATPWDDLASPQGRVIVWACLQMVFLTAGTAFAVRQFKPRRIRLTITNERRFVRVLYISAAFGIVSILWLLQAAGGLTSLLSGLSTRRDMLSGLGFIGALAAIPAAASLLLLLARPKGPAQRILVVALSAEYFGYLFISGARFPLISYAIALLLAVSHRRRVPPGAFVVLLLAAVPFSTWYAISVRKTSRSVASQGSETSTIFSTLHSSLEPFINGGVDTLRTLSAPIAAAPGDWHFNISNFFGGLFTLVPRVVWPNKPNGVSIAFSQQYFSDRWEQGTGVPPSILAESIFFFGAIGGLLYLLLVGILLGWCSVRAWRTTSPFMRIMFIFTTSDAIVWVKSGSDSFFRSLTLHGVGLLVLYFMTRQIEIVSSLRKDTNDEASGH